jgi:oligoribonuclease NrnB/cAMP/cGMP phosphodiesterase (DHH superfamily)
MPKKIAVFYHGNCRDGLGGAWAAWKKLGDKADYTPLVWEESKRLDINGKTIYFIDFMPDIAVILKLQKNNKVIGIDHHVSAEASTKSTDNYSYAVNHSGAVLSWKYFHPGKPIPRLLRYIEDTDIWKWKLPHSKEVSARLDLSGNTSIRDLDRLASDFENPGKFKKFIEEGKILLDAGDREIEEIIRLTETPVRFEGKKSLAVNSPVQRSQIGHILAEKTGTFGIVWVERSNVIKVSLRSVKNFDVAKIAEKYGGGGHKNAASFMVKKGSKLPWKVIKK